MRLGAVLRAPTGVDPLRAAGGFGAVAGAASLVAPYFLGLAEALAAIAAVAWAVRLPRDPRRVPRRTWAVAGAVVAAGGFAVLAVPPWSALRGAFLGVAAAALAATAPAAPEFGAGDR
jgi:hypothetical protein